MSWSLFVTIPKGSTADEARDLIFDAVPSGNEDAVGERNAAVHFAQTVASDLLEDEVLGVSGACAWEVSLSGHCNPGNEQRREWSNDAIHIHVSQKSLDPVVVVNAGESGGGKS